MSMTDEQIKQNAEEYANCFYDRLYQGGMWQECVKTHIAGAHSRDVEVESLQRRVSIWKHEAEVAAKELDQLRNPWISIEERLPEKINKFMSEPVLCRYTRGNKEYFHVSQYDFDFDEWQISNVTHWMPIPQIEKGE